MKQIYALILSEDGLSNYAFSDKQKLFDFVNESGYDITAIELFSSEDKIEFNHKNFINNFDEIYMLHSNDSSYIELKTLLI
jgi:hypothetical protein